MINRIVQYIKSKNRAGLMLVFSLLAIYASAQTYLSSQVGLPVDQVPLKPQVVPSQNGVTQKKAPVKIDLISANRIDKKIGFDGQILTDSVIFSHDGTILYCDSALYDEGRNTFDAYRNVRMEQGDSIVLYGNTMHYEGNTNMVTVRQNVRIENGSVTLFTDSLDYDRANNIGYYFDGGMLVDAENELTSYWGQYEPNKNLAIFSDSVKLVNPQFTLYSDTLRYNTENKIATLVSPTKIVSDSGIILTSNGLYNTVTQQSELFDQSTVLNNIGDRILRGDTIIFNRTTGIGQIYGNMFLHDTTRKVILRGHYGFYDEKADFTYAADSAYCIEYSQGDSLYLHADTLQMSVDSIYRVIKGYHGVRFYRADLQGVCDSMQFNSRDSILHLFRDPILWNEGNQISGDTIDVIMGDSSINYIHIKKYSFSIEKKDSTSFNQMKGRSMKVFMNGQRVRRIYIEGNAESIFYPEEDNGNVIGLNWLESSYLEILFNQGKLDKLTVWPAPVGKLTPMDMIEPSQLRLADFYWYDYIRPLSKDDIFRKVSKKAEDIKPKRSAIFTEELQEDSQ